MECFCCWVDLGYDLPMLRVVRFQYHDGSFGVKGRAKEA